MPHWRRLQPFTEVSCWNLHTWGCQGICARNKRSQVISHFIHYIHCDITWNTTPPKKMSQTLKMFIYEEPQEALNLCQTILSKRNVPPWPLFTRILRSDGSVSKGGPLGQERSNVTHVTLKFSKKATGAPLMHWPSTFCGRNIIEALVLATYIIMWTILSKTNKWLAWGIVKYWSFGM